MKNIGALIKKLRLNRGMSAKELADGICTSKYIYMIESGERTPSIEIVDQFSMRLRYDIFSITPYLGYKNPMEAIEKMREIENLGIVSNFEAVKKLLGEIKTEETPRWLQYSFTVKAYICAFLDEAYDEAFDLVKEGLAVSGLDIEFDSKLLTTMDIDDLTLYNLLGVIYTRRGEYKNALVVLSQLHDYFLSVNAYTKFDNLIITNMVSLASLYTALTDYNSSLDVLYNCRTRMFKTNSSHFIHIVYFSISYNLYRICNYTEASNYLIVAKQLSKDRNDLTISEAIEFLQTDIDKKAIFNGDNNIKCIDSFELIDDNGNLINKVELVSPNILILTFEEVKSTYFSELIHETAKLCEKHLPMGRHVHCISDLRKTTDSTILMDGEQLSQYYDERKKLMNMFPIRSLVQIFSDDKDKNMMMKHVLELIDFRSFVLDGNCFETTSIKKGLEIVRLIDSL